MKEYMLRLVVLSQYTGDWEMRFREHEDKNAIDSSVKHLTVVGNNPAVVGAQLFYMQPTGTIKEFVPIFIFEVGQRVVCKDAHHMVKANE